MTSPGRVAQRPVTDADEPFLRRLYASTREAELEQMPFDEEQKLQFLCFQYDAQHAHYTSAHPDASFQLVLVDGEPAGRLYVASSDERIHLIDIALLPTFRGHGVGEQLLRGLIGEADVRGRSVTAHVERHNRALRLYRHLGFEIAEEGDVYLLMRWSAPAPAGS
ncbi:MAG TPA: GNAT family N-acetyltransferase [Solirubrobacteraceae bacterium]|nr:GNAT family N-acetyltransferase [Solirubrobacteraceae bacterium]